MNFKKIIGLASCACLILNLTGCTSSKLSMQEEASWGTLLAQGVVNEPIQFKSVKGAGITDFILPGVGSMYVAGTDAIGWFVGGVLLWPISPFYTSPIGVNNAKNVNKRRTVEYYKFGARADEIDRLVEKDRVPANFKRNTEVNVSI